MAVNSNYILRILNSLIKIFLFLLCVLSQTTENTLYLSFGDCIISLCLIVSNKIHLITEDKISLIFMT